MAEAAEQIVRNKTASRFITSLEGTDPTSYINFESTFRMNAARTNWNDQEQKYQCKAKIKGEALQMCRHLPHDVADQTIEQFLQLLRDKFVPPAAGTAARANYRSTCQLQDETIKQFSSKLLEQFFLAYPGRRETFNVDADLIEHFITKLSCHKTAELVMGRSPQTYAEAYNAAESITASQVIMAAARQDRPMINQLSATTSPKPAFPGQGLQRETKISCWGCGQENHIQRNCPNKPAFRGQQTKRRGNPACWGCGKTNHKFSNCFHRNQGQPRGRGRGFHNRGRGFNNRNYGTRRPFPTINYMQGMDVDENDQNQSETGEKSENQIRSYRDEQYQ